MAVTPKRMTRSFWPLSRKVLREADDPAGSSLADDVVRCRQSVVVIIPVVQGANPKTPIDLVSDA